MDYQITVWNVYCRTNFEVEFLLSDKKHKISKNFLSRKMLYTVNILVSRKPYFIQTVMLTDKYQPTAIEGVDMCSWKM